MNRDVIGATPLSSANNQAIIDGISLLPGSSKLEAVSLSPLETQIQPNDQVSAGIKSLSFQGYHEEIDAKGMPQRALIMLGALAVPTLLIPVGAAPVAVSLVTLGAVYAVGLGYKYLFHK